ncbi:hypothetical protein [Planctobacterium marinum]|uniref:hypothetical protein n=1 Tax=Planctobacterium marinum TaxID=1631968 RepID=UPI001E627696|nr:hypothetical protein [Planctobacterium marinum]MCC2604901.1 hypothetical protein [Planctobacterium marinum]
MKNKFLIISCTLLIMASTVSADNSIRINATAAAALLDGKCGSDEWDAATKLDLPAGASLLMMQDKDYFYLCARGKPEDYTVLDVFIKHPQTKQLHKFHLSAQMGEAIFVGNDWRPSATWDLQDYAGFWVPYFGLQDPENRKDPKFAKGTHRQIQIARKKFAGNLWTMMIGVSAIIQGDKNVSLFFPEQAQETDVNSWALFSFSDE